MLSSAWNYKTSFAWNPKGHQICRFGSEQQFCLVKEREMLVICRARRLKLNKFVSSFIRLYGYGGHNHEQKAVVEKFKQDVQKLAKDIGAEAVEGWSKVGQAVVELSGSDLKNTDNLTKMPEREAKEGESIDPRGTAAEACLDEEGTVAERAQKKVKEGVDASWNAFDDNENEN
jgi:hypothetical protein